MKDDIEALGCVWFCFTFGKNCFAFHAVEKQEA
ncbi:hypothetical protein BRADI_3g27756v3 [Brachypodium distachyon]|uniref:Uncharacterized protein n=1 Tax=Brachypodium distachyon TaxID=15368 RepID=A0A2K2CZL5_BRADI|nr:hypothetical protein BRADI_3g27756v3 [Brachypodium distachyon]